jgi:hypothetical protein
MVVIVWSIDNPDHWQSSHMIPRDNVCMIIHGNGEEWLNWQASLGARIA